MHFYTKGWQPVQTCIQNVGKEGFKCAHWQQDILDGFIAEKTDDVELNGQILDGLKTGHEEFIKQDLGTIALLASIAPLLGLLGTVGGMIKTFNVSAEFGTGNAKAMSGGISEAMITTQFGLVVAIIGIYVSMILTRRARHFETLVREISIHLIVS